MNGYAVIIEGEGDSLSAHVPDLPGCIAAGTSDGIHLHIERLRERGDRVPPPTAAGATIVESPAAS